MGLLWRRPFLRRLGRRLPPRGRPPSGGLAFARGLALLLGELLAAVRTAGVAAGVTGLAAEPEAVATALRRSVAALGRLATALRGLATTLHRLAAPRRFAARRGLLAASRLLAPRRLLALSVAVALLAALTLLTLRRLLVLPTLSRLLALPRLLTLPTPLGLLVLPRLLALPGLLAPRRLAVLSGVALLGHLLARDVVSLVSRLSPVAEAHLFGLPPTDRSREDGLLAPQALFHVLLDLLGAPLVGRASRFARSVLAASLVSASLSVSVAHR